MIKFDLQYKSRELTIDPQENGVYRIMENDDKVGVIYATIDNGNIGWSTQDELPNDFVKELGSLITEHNDSSS